MRDGPIRLPVAVPEHAGVLTALIAARHEAHVLLIAPSPSLRDRAGSPLQWLLEHGPVPRVFLQWPSVTGSPYDEVVESPFVVASRLGVLGNVAFGENPFVLVMDAASAAVRVLPFERFAEAIARLEVGRTTDLTWLARLLTDAGYRRVSTVAEVGEFAVRGGILDVFSPGTDDPVRIEMDGDEVASLKAFDAATQRAIRPLVSAWVFPAWEVPTDPEARRESLLRLRDLAEARGASSRYVAQIEATLEEGRLPPGFAGMLGSWHGRLGLLWDYVPEDAVIAVLDPLACAAEADAALQSLQEEFYRAGRRLCDDPTVLRASGVDLLQPLRERANTLFFDTGGEQPVLGASDLPAMEIALATSMDLPISDRTTALCDLATAAVSRGDRVVIPCPTEAEARRVTQILTSQGLRPSRAIRNAMAEVLRPEPGVRVGVGRVRSPFRVEALGLVVIPSEAVFGVKDVAGLRRERGRSAAERLWQYRDLEPGELVIHRDHGLARFGGLEEVALGDGSVSECLVLSYLGGDRLLVPVDRVHLLERYVAPPEGPSRPLDRLGSPVWNRRKRAARRAAREIAGKLKEIYARRLAGQAHAFEPPDADFREFEAAFPYETTADQDQAIEDVLQDLTRERPMDRLVCGDVGFGKTEVAIRASYLVAMGGKQVAVLVPTTLLAEQHRLTFAARFHRTPVVVESLSRFKSPSETRRILADLKAGRIDVVIGTHRLLSSDVVFRDLGLLIVDEEHRFGVSHKERLREIATTVHTLTLSATPIPRTLQMALSGIRELSVIATPPRDRLAVKTVVARESSDLIRAVILREIRRGGQVFFVHNRVEDIYDVASRVSSWVPEARVTVAHGQMSATDLEGVMAAFLRGEKDVLVCTTIVQSGLDIVTANTMVIREAASLGLADLYQLRGRVGRGSEQAWCYLLVDDPAHLSGEARRRIEAIERFSELASGFHIATLDLEIRGAGTLLGAEQSGHLSAVGQDLFLEMIRDAVREVTGHEVIARPDPEIHVSVEARFPPSYVSDEATRLRLYRRLAGARDLSEVAALASEIRDRFGPLPEPARNLLGLMRVRVLARERGISDITVRNRRIEVRMVQGESSERLAAGAKRLGMTDVQTHPDRVEVRLSPTAQPLLVLEEWLRASGEEAMVNESPGTGALGRSSGPR